MPHFSLYQIETPNTNKKVFFLVQHHCTLSFPIASLTVEHDRNSGLFIESLDTTGLFEPRPYQTFYVQAFVLYVIRRMAPFYLETFSHPKRELIFLKHGKLRKVMAPRKLLMYWQNIFRMADYHVMVHSNYYRTASIIKCTDDLHFFDDDPKSKIERVEIDDFWLILLQRRDFVEGGIVIALKSVDGRVVAASDNIPNRNVIVGLSEYFEVSLVVSENVYEFLSKIRKIDHRTAKTASDGLKDILKTTSMFTIPAIRKEEIQAVQESPIIQLTPRKKHR